MSFRSPRGFYHRRRRHCCHGRGGHWSTRRCGGQIAKKSKTTRSAVSCTDWSKNTKSKLSSPQKLRDTSEASVLHPFLVKYTSYWYAHVGLYIVVHEKSGGELKKKTKPKPKTNKQNETENEYRTSPQSAPTPQLRTNGFIRLSFFPQRHVRWNRSE